MCYYSHSLLHTCTLFINLISISFSPSLCSPEPRQGAQTSGKRSTSRPLSINPPHLHLNCFPLAGITKSVPRSWYTDWSHHSSWPATPDFCLYTCLHLSCRLSTLYRGSSSNKRRLRIPRMPRRTAWSGCTTHSEQSPFPSWTTVKMILWWRCLGEAPLPELCVFSPPPSAECFLLRFPHCLLYLQPSPPSSPQKPFLLVQEKRQKLPPSPSTTTTLQSLEISRYK